MLSDDAHSRTENSSSFPSLHERGSYVPEIAKEARGSGFGRGADKLVASGEQFRV